MSVKIAVEAPLVVTTSQTVSTDFDDYLIDASGGAVVLTLMLAATTGIKGKCFTFSRLDSSANAVTVVAAGSDLINTVPTLFLGPGDVVKIIKRSQTAWWYIMDAKRIASTQILVATGAVNPAIEIVQLDTSGAVIAASLPLASTLPLGTKIQVVTTSAANAGTVVPSGSDTINGAGTPIATVVNVGKTFFTISTTAWRQL